MEENDEDIIAELRCIEKVGLTLVRNALEEAQSDYKEIGRPLTIQVHDGAYLSMLSQWNANTDEK